MAINRAGYTPPFVDYLTRYALTPNWNTGNVKAVTDLNPDWIEIPRFQRGVTWKVDDIKEFYDSTSILLGNVIMGTFPLPPLIYPNLRPIVINFNYLMDGLQRFSVGTIMLRALHDAVIKPSPDYPTQSGYFSRLIPHTLPYTATYMHNHEELMNHPRTAISQPYKLLYASFCQHLIKVFADGEGETFGRNIERLFVDRQVAIDPYNNFRTLSEITSTFIGINTVRIDLNVIDLVRSFIVDRGQAAGWSSTQIEIIENRFTEVFCNENGSPDSDLFPFVGIAWRVFEKNEQDILFPSWSSTLLLVEVENFINFIETFKDGNIINSFITEIRNTGKAPYAVLISIYYYKYIFFGTSPSFFSGGNAEDPELHKFLISTYRGLIDGGIGKSRSLGEDVFLKSSPAPGAVFPYTPTTFPKEVALVADVMSHKFSGISIYSQYNSNVLNSALRKINKIKSKTVFNAMLLPILPLPRTTGWGAIFTPLIYGTSVRRLEFNIDHLIPKSAEIKTQRGYNEIELLNNLCPLPARDNVIAKATLCSIKIRTGGVYDSYITTPGSYTIHPYSMWITRTHSTIHNVLTYDDQRNLEQGASPDVGTDRIDYITQFLLDKL